MEPGSLMFCPICMGLRRGTSGLECHGSWKPFPPAPLPEDAPWRIVHHRLKGPRLSDDPCWYRPLCDGYVVLCATSWGKATMEIKDADNFSMWFVEEHP